MNDKYVRQEENIKNCPFCGSSVSVERVPLEHYKGCVIFEIKCLNCGCERTLTKNDSVYRTEEEARANAIAQWNERTSPAVHGVLEPLGEGEYKCTACGAELEVHETYVEAISYCPSCGADVRFCPDCGADMREVPNADV